MELALKSGKGILLLLSRQIGIHIQGGAYVCMPHNFLDDLQRIWVRRIFAHSATKCMSQMMNGKVRKQCWASIFNLRQLDFRLVVICNNPWNRTIDTMGGIYATKAVGKDKSAISIYDCIVFSLLLLACFFLKQCPSNFIKHWYFTNPCLRFWGCNVIHRMILTALWLKSKKEQNLSGGVAQMRGILPFWKRATAESKRPAQASCKRYKRLKVCLTMSAPVLYNWNSTLTIA